MYIYMFMRQRQRERERARWCKTAGVAATATNTDHRD